MTGALDSTALEIANSLIRRYGQAVTYTEPPAAGDYNPATGAVTDTPATHEWFGLVTTWEDAMSVRGTARAGRMAVMVPASGAGFVPGAGWRATVHGRALVVTEVESIGPGEAVVAWVLGFKG